MLFDGLVFFSEAGNSDQFGVGRTGNQGFFGWNHEDDNRTWVAATVMRFLEEWMTGRRTV
jgi:hypothetical protein